MSRLPCFNITKKSLTNEHLSGTSCYYLKTLLYENQGKAKKEAVTYNFYIL